MQKIKCKICKYLKPRCERGKRIHKDMVQKFLENGLEMDEAHLKRWDNWINHKHKGQ